MKENLISIVVANYNGEKYLDVCLKSILKSLYINFELLIVDDGSSDDSITIIKKFQKTDSRILLFCNKKNMGAAASRNMAIKKAKGTIVVFLDNDTEVGKDWIAGLLNPLYGNKNIGASQALLLDFKKRDQVQMAGGLLIPHTGWLAPFYHLGSYKKIKKSVDERQIVGISAALAVKREVLNVIGGFDGKEACYTEDLDFCWRIWIAGYRIVLAPKSIVYHWTKSVEQRASMKASYKQIYFHLVKNSIRSMIKNYEPTNMFKYLPSTVLVNLGRGLLVLIKRRDISALGGTFHALGWNLSNLADTITCRNEVQKTRKVPDSLLLSKVFERESLIRIYKKYFNQTKLLW